MQQTELRPALAAQEGARGKKKRGGEEQEKIQRDGGGLDGLREDYGVGQRAEHRLVQFEDMQKVRCRLKK